MNEIECIEGHYLRANRTIETIVITIGDQKHVSYIYNYEGIHFRFFINIEDLIDFFAKRKEPKYQFEDEQDLDNFLLNIPEKEFFYIMFK
ncbi:MAG: hypothetical protein LBU90_03025 [Bacteroidales bacterium]|jgi:hypothetical protein|nr:hypothetical protein [Bacteroidales bacterium]